MTCNSHPVRSLTTRSAYMSYKRAAILALATLTLAGQTLPPITSRNSCVVPIGPADVSRPTSVVGTGSATSCTEAALDAAMRRGGVITFNCGTSPAVIPITKEHAFRNDMHTVLDGGNRVTLRANGNTRIFVARSGDPPYYGGTSPWYKSTRNSVTLQNITFQNARSTGPSLPPLPLGAPANCAQGTEFEGGGAVIYVRDIVLHVINARFEGNNGPPLGPDVAGGGIYALGSVDVTVVGSTFIGNSASNGGALGTLQSNVVLVNNTFHDNRAVGRGGNYDIRSSGCPLHLNQYQVGSGGSAGAVYFDGEGDKGVVLCGNQFRRNTGTDAMGGAVWVAGDPNEMTATIAQSYFEANRNAKGGAIFSYKAKLVVFASTFVNNTAEHGGAVQTNLTRFTGVNNTFSGNRAVTAVGTLALFAPSTGVLLNNTFVNNSAPYFPVLFHGDNTTAAPNIVLVNNVFQGNTSTRYSMPCNSTLAGANNIMWPSMRSPLATEAGCAGDTIVTNPLLGALGDYGGGLLTMPISTTSPAAGYTDLYCPDVDARGVTRSARCASGSFEPK